MIDTPSNSAAVKAQIKQLRRERASAAGKIDRADTQIMFLRRKINEERQRFRLAGEQIVELGGKVKW